MKTKLKTKGTLGKGTVGGILFLLTAILSVQTFAAETVLLTTTRSDKPDEVTVFRLVTSQTGDLVGLRMDAMPLIEIDALGRGVTTQEGYVPIPFRGKRHRKFVVLKSVGRLNEKEGGLIDLLYLTNALTYKMSSFRVSVERIGSKWQAFTDPKADHRPFNAMNFTIGNVGINHVEVAQKKSLFSDSELQFMNFEN